MAVSKDFADYVLEQVERTGPVAAKRMFGGVALMDHGAMFALLAGNRVFFAVDDASRAKFEKAGMECFTYGTKHGPKQMKGFYELPEGVLDDAAELRAWVRDAKQAALAKKA